MKKINVIILGLILGSNVSASPYPGDTPLVCAASKRHIEAVTFLVEHGADVNAKNDGWTALMIAAHGRKEIVKMLIKAGADVNMNDDDGRTALMKAAAEGYTEIAEMLIEHGADVNMKDNDGKTALMYAEAERHVEIASMLENEMQKMPINVGS